MTLEWGAAWAQVIAATGAVIVGIFATVVGLLIASKERAASQERWRVDREESHERWVRDHAESHEQWVRDQQLQAYIRFDGAFMEWQRIRMQRLGFIRPRLQREWQSAMSSLELLGSANVRRQVYHVLALAATARKAPSDRDAWERFAVSVDSLRGTMQHEMRISSVEAPDAEGREAETGER